MSGARGRTAQGLVATAVLCALGLIVCGYFSARGNLWEKALIALMMMMLGSMAAALALAAATYVGLRVAMARRLRRPALSDAQFAALLPGEAPVDPKLVGRIRALTARHFRSLGGDRFYPDDHIEQDLHFADLAPFACERFCQALEEELGLHEGALDEALGEARVQTFGDIVAVAASAAGRRKPEAPDADALPAASGPLWDRALDG